MICYECAYRPICKIHEDVHRYSSFASIDIKACQYYVIKKVDPNDYYKKQAAQPVKKPMERTIDDINKINDLSRKLRQEKEERAKEFKKEKPKPKLNYEAKPLELDHVCSTCNATTWKEDLRKCDNCKKQVCSNCATVDFDSDQILCQECWEKL